MYDGPVSNDDKAGYPAGNRTERPHHPDGWFPDRPADDPNTVMPPRGRPPASGEHDRPTKG